MAITRQVTNGKKEPVLVTQELVNLYKQAGIDPATGLPTRVIDPNRWKEAVKLALRVVDEQDAVNRYRWFNMPVDMPSNEIERLIYYKGNLIEFYLPEIDKFLITAYALDGEIDYTGRYITVKPVPIASGATEVEKKKTAILAQYLSTKRLKVYYDVPIEDLTYEERINACVILQDYTRQLAQTIIPRQQINDPILDLESDCLPMLRTALRNATGVLGMRVTNEDEKDSVLAANIARDRAVLNGEGYIPIIGALEFQELAGGEVAKGEEYLMAMQSIDNFRLSLLGIQNGGLFSKNQYQNTAEVSMNGGQNPAQLQDGLNVRQHACDIANALWGVGQSCELSECAAQMDMDGNGALMDDDDQMGSAPGDQPAQTAEGDEM